MLKHVGTRHRIAWEITTTRDATAASPLSPKACMSQSTCQSEIVCVRVVSYPNPTCGNLYLNGT